MPGCRCGRIVSSGRPHSDNWLDWVNGHSRRDAARLNAEGAGNDKVSSAETWRDSRLPTPCRKGSPEASTHTARPRSFSTSATLGSKGTVQARGVPRINAAANLRCREPPNTTSADWMSSRAVRLRPPIPSSPIPTMDSQRWNAAGWGSATSASGMKKNILILGGTTEARLLGERLAVRTDMTAILSLAGRTAAPLPQGVPTRSGGFGGTAGLIEYLRTHEIGAVIDATHPYASTMSAHALHAARQTTTPLLCLCRPPWIAVAGDEWTEVRDVQEAANALGAGPRRVFLAVGRQEIANFAVAPQNYYLIRSVDPVDPPLAVPRARYILDRGPFTEVQERELLRAHAIDVIVAKNSGGAATYGKIAAARALSIPVVLLRRPPALDVPTVATVGEAMSWLDHELKAPADRGV